MWTRADCEDQQHAPSHTSIIARRRKRLTTFGQSHLYFLKTKFFLYNAGASESIEDVKSELFKVLEMVRNVRTTEVPTEFDVAWALMNAIDNEAYELVKSHLEEMNDITSLYTVERMRAVEIRLKDTNTSVSGLAV